MTTGGGFDGGVAKCNPRTARLVMTYRIEFSEAALAEAPPHLRHGMSLLREILGDLAVLETEFLEEAKEMFRGENGIQVVSATVQVAS